MAAWHGPGKARAQCYRARHGTEAEPGRAVPAHRLSKRPRPGTPCYRASPKHDKRTGPVKHAMSPISQAHPLRAAAATVTQSPCSPRPPLCGATCLLAVTVAGRRTSHSNSRWEGEGRGKEGGRGRREAGGERLVRPFVSQPCSTHSSALYIRQKSANLKL
jgi:hypothetical protein